MPAYLPSPQEKGAYVPRPSSSYTTASSNSTQSARSSRGYGGKPQAVVVHKPSGPSYDPNTSTSAAEGSRWK